MAQQESPAFKQLKDQLREMFQLDRGDLDFGIYRIMNQKRSEVTKFLDEQLLPQVREILEKYQPASASTTYDELNKLLASLNDAGVDPETSPKVKELRAKLGQPVDINKLENEIYSDLYNFFKRYYSEGDFMSMRRYKEGVYALPYEGEEVKLHWANHDQYYIKTSEDLKNYSFKTAGGKKRVRFEVVAGGTETNNNKAAEGKERRFILHADAPVQVNGDELIIRFEYRPDDAKHKQDDLNKETLDQILNLAEETAYGLKDKAASEKNADRTLLEKHLTDYTAKNTFDYFIHKDLGKFLRQELDFYIKNEIIHLDDIENEAPPKVETYLAKVKAMRKVAGKIIQFLAQLENFQKKLWLKKKFVLETHYCVTLDHIIGSEVEGELLPIIAANDAQREEWVKLFAIDDVKGYANPLTVDFLKANDKLLVDTKFFDANFKYALLRIFDDLDAQTNGLMINSENFQALNLLHHRYKQKIKCIYIDPPYNSPSSEIIYKNTYKHSSWLSLMNDRLCASKLLQTDDGSIAIAIDKHEQENLGVLLDSIYPEHKKTCVTVQHNKKGTQGRFFSYNHEYAYFVIPESLSKLNERLVPQENWEYGHLRNWGGESLRGDAKNCFYPIFVRDGKVEGAGNVCPDDFHPESSNIQNDDGTISVYPIDQQGIERKWRYSYDSVKKILHTLRVDEGKKGLEIKMPKLSDKFKTIWDKNEYIAGDFGTRVLTDMGFPSTAFDFPKSVYTVRDSVYSVSDNDSTIIDYFAGSGTTAHAVLDLNREDKGTRKYILVEMGNYFATTTKPRVLKSIFSRKWSNGKPQELESHLQDLKKTLADRKKNLKYLSGIDDFEEFEFQQQALKGEIHTLEAKITETEKMCAEGVSKHGGSQQLLKYHVLEAYEDTLDNLGLSKSETQAALLASNPTLNEQYMLGYMLDVESRGSQSLLNIDAFADPFAYTLRITRNDDTQVVNVDLIETFNYLLGLTVRTVDRDKSGIVTVTGKNSLGENCLIIWRNVNEIDNAKLDAWFGKRYSSKDFEFDAIYVNGDNNIENMKLADDHWKVRLIEAEFKRLMFDVQDV